MGQKCPTFRQNLPKFGKNQAERIDSRLGAALAKEAGSTDALNADTSISWVLRELRPVASPLWAENKK